MELRGERAEKIVRNIRSQRTITLWGRQGEAWVEPRKKESNPRNKEHAIIECAPLVTRTENNLADQPNCASEDSRGSERRNEAILRHVKGKKERML